MAKTVKKSVPAQTRTTSQPAGASPEGENIDKIRDILFGAQTRQFDKKITAMENKIDQEKKSLQKEMKSSFETLEQFIQKEMKHLSDQLADETTDRGDAVDQLEAKLTDARKSYEKKISQLSEKMIKDQREMQAQIRDQSKNLNGKLDRNTDEMEQRLKEAVAELTHEKTDRLALANLLMEAGMRLKDEFQLPEVE